MKHPIISLAPVVLLVSCGGSGGGNSASEAETNPTEIDSIAPEIFVLGTTPYNISQYATFTDPGVSARDLGGEIEDLSDQIVIGGDTVNTDIPGEYIITYDVADSAGNQAEQGSRVVIVNKVTRLPALNDTGNTAAAVSPSGLASDCSSSEYADEDCQRGRDRLASEDRLVKSGAGYAGFDFTKLASDGSPLLDQTLSYSETGSNGASTKWQCVRDNVTGLIWEVKSDTPQGSNLHSVNDTFTWYLSEFDRGTPESSFSTRNSCTGYVDADGEPDTTNTDSDPNNCNTQAFVERVNASQLCGFTDWRLPTLQELHSIIIYNDTTSYDSDFFPNIAGGAQLWTLSVDDGDPLTIFAGSSRPRNSGYRHEAMLVRSQ